MVGLVASVQTVVLGAVLLVGGAYVASRERQDEPAFIAPSLGYFDIDRQEHSAAEGMVVYRGARPFWGFRLFGAVLATSHGSFFAGAGIAYDLFLGKVTFTPSFAPGFYAPGDGLDLGYPLEFRSQLEASYRLPGRWRLGVGFSHMSNASLGKTNPGVETLLVVVSVPVGGSP
jgi:hypothetical protein